MIADPALLGPDLQPIHRLADGALIGHKATGRGRAGTEVGDTLTLLEGAKTLGLVERLDWAFRCHSFDVALATLDVGELHLTPEPETFGSACPPRLAERWRRGRRELSIVAELHGDAFVDAAVLEAALAEMRGWGWRFAVADLAGDAVVQARLASISPAYVEVDLADLRRAGTPEVARWLAAGRAAGAEILAVGVAGPAAQQVARELGAGYLRSPAPGAGTAGPGSGVAEDRSDRR